MQFKIGDTVVHSAYGVGQIVNIEAKQFTAKVVESLYYELATPKCTVWVPVDAIASEGLRILTAQADLAHYAKVLTATPVPLTKDHRKRHLELTAGLKQGSFQVVCEVVRDLTACSWIKPLNWMDTASLRRARETLYQEWAASAGVATPEAMRVIEALLSEGRRAYLAQNMPEPKPVTAKVPARPAPSYSQP